MKKKQQKTAAPSMIHNWRKCPRCGATDTVAYGKKGDVQYRRCRMATCRQEYKTKAPE